MRLLLILVLVIALAVPAAAGPTRSDVVRTSSGGVAITTGLGSPVGPSLFDVATDGTAALKFVWFKDPCTSRAAADSTAQQAAIVWVQLRDYTPPRSLFFPSGPDSVYVLFGTATEVILSR